MDLRPLGTKEAIHGLTPKPVVLRTTDYLGALEGSAHLHLIF